MAVILVLPSTVSHQQGPVAAFVSTAGWASAFERVIGRTWVVTPSGVLGVTEARRRGSDPHLRSSGRRRWAGAWPETVVTAAKDLRSAHRARRFEVTADGPWRGAEIDLVWQRHELFHTAGLDLARDLGVPSVLFVPATAVWEARRWGVRRPGWGRAIEWLGEARILRRADLVACGSTVVAEQVSRLGVPAERILVTPTGVDVDIFDRSRIDRDVRAERGLQGRRVVGWIGSFRPFHALPSLVRAMVGLEDTDLLLVGDGPERPEIERLARELDVSVTFTGTVAHDEVPAHLAAMDVAVVLAGSDADFHYSPLKLAEYLAAGLPVVAPDLAPIRARGTDGMVLVRPGDVGSLHRAVAHLLDDDDERQRMSRAAGATARRALSWDQQVRSVMAALERREDEPVRQPSLGDLARRRRGPRWSTVRPD